MVGFADDEFETENYILLQKAFEFDTQDVELGMDGEYIEINGQENSGYKCVEQAMFNNERFYINVKSETGRINRVEVDLSQIEIDEEEMVRFLLDILPDKIHFL